MGKVVTGLRLTAAACLAAAFLIVVAAGLPDKARVNAIGFIGVGQLPVAPEVGGIAPTLDGTRPDGQAIPIARGKPILINFWATWCGPCVAELPALEAAYRAHQADGLQVIAVNMGEAPETVTTWISPFQLSFDIMIDPERRLFARYQVRGAPSTYFVDQKGIIRRIIYGPLTAGDLQAALTEISAP